jgi:hypothetical protein
VHIECDKGIKNTIELAVEKFAVIKCEIKKYTIITVDGFPTLHSAADSCLWSATTMFMLGDLGLYTKFLEKHNMSALWCNRCMLSKQSRQNFVIVCMNFGD